LINGQDSEVVEGLETQLSKLDELLALLADGPQSEQGGSAAEHLQAARAYLLGSMREEFELSLSMAEQAIEGLPHRETRVKAELLLNDVRNARPVPMM
jgi:hypothetical protein